MKRFEREVRDGVLILKHIDKRVIDESLIHQIGRELLAVLDEDNQWERIVLDFSLVEYYASAALQKLIDMDKKVKRLERRWVICSIRADVFEIFQITKLTQLFDIKDNLDDALASFEAT